MITVPSCDLHNGSKKKDDEYLKHTIVAAMKQPSAEGNLMIDSVLRSYDHRPKLLKDFLREVRPVVFNGEETAMFTVDVERFNRSIDLLTRALWFRSRGQKLMHPEIVVHWLEFWEKSGKPNPLAEILLDFESRWPSKDYHGKHKTIFAYDFHELRTKEEPGSYLWVSRFRFFEGRPVCAMWHGREDAPRVISEKATASR